MVVAGGGIVGLATARELLLRRPGARLLLLEREERLATQQTGHNSGVIHSGVYYAPGSLKARTCVEGRRALLRYCDEKAIPYRMCGKVIVALDASELPRLEELYRRAQANGVEDVEMIGPQRLRELEPHVVGVRALRVGATGVIDFGAVAAAFAEDVRSMGGEIRTGCRVHSVFGGRVVTSAGRFAAERVVACAGLYSDRLARASGAPDGLRIVPFRGDYYEVTRNVCRALIYPVPDPAFPFLGVHFTRLMDGRLLAGPNAVLAFARQGYGRWDVDWRDLFEVLTFPGFWRLASKYWRTGLLEMWRDYSKTAYLRALQAYVPSLAPSDLAPGPSGVRAQALSRDGRLIDDFSVFEGPGVLHVRNAPSPAATSSLAIAAMIADRS